mgnify:CR=1 FL=1
MVYRIKCLGYEFSSECFYFILFFQILSFLTWGAANLLLKNLSEQSREPTNSSHIWCRFWELNLPNWLGGGGCSHHCTITFLQEIANKKLYLEGKSCQQQYYFYFQVNGTLVTHFNHAEVVDLIKCKWEVLFKNHNQHYHQAIHQQHLNQQWHGDCYHFRLHYTLGLIV